MVSFQVSMRWSFVDHLSNSKFLYNQFFVCCYSPLFQYRLIRGNFSKDFLQRIQLSSIIEQIWTILSVRQRQKRSEHFWKSFFSATRFQFVYYRSRLSEFPSSKNNDDFFGRDFLCSFHPLIDSSGQSHFLDFFVFATLEL